VGNIENVFSKLHLLVIPAHFRKADAVPTPANPKHIFYSNVSGASSGNFSWGFPFESTVKKRTALKVHDGFVVAVLGQDKITTTTHAVGFLQQQPQMLNGIV